MVHRGQLLCSLHAYLYEPIQVEKTVFCWGLTQIDYLYLYLFFGIKLFVEFVIY